MANEIVEIKATARPRAGKGAARHARREGSIPAVIYGDKQSPEIITLDYNTLWKQILKGHFTSTVFDIDIEGKSKIRAIPRDVQLDPVKDTPLHVDFLRIGKDGIIRVSVPVRFVNDSASPGLKRGGILNIVRHDVEIFCPYDKIPTHLEADLTGIDIGRSIHISAIPLPDGVKPTIQNRDFTVATIQGSKKEEEASAASAAAAPDAGAAKAAAPAKGAAPAKAAAPAAGAKPAAAPAAKKK
ncbi:MAG: 50S ribosomal protein L25/general stress protein Ctc [Hyphomicrobium sp.]|nr:50S ribosomal protein L25/general stress protein Ctc [Hyphomicrobium sp.]